MSRLQSLNHFSNKYFILILLGTNILIWYSVFYFERHQNLSINFFDVGQGDAIFIEAPNGNQILIDGGPNDAILSKLGRTMPFWDRSIDLLILTHPHADHLDGALEVLKRYHVGMVIESGVNHSISEYEEWRVLLKEKKIKAVTARSGQRINVLDGGYLDILMPLEDFVERSPKNIHDAVVISKLNYGLRSVLLMGDAERSLEYQLISSGFNLRADLLKAGHHGSKTSSSGEFLRAVSPGVVVIQSGRKNRYGHPHQEILDRLAFAGAKIFRNDLDGDLAFESDGTFLIKK